jgi:hypothetical protein
MPSLEYQLAYKMSVYTPDLHHALVLTLKYRQSPTFHNTAMYDTLNWLFCVMKYGLLLWGNLTVYKLQVFLNEWYRNMK